MKSISWLSQSQWEKLLLRWSGMEPIGEVRLVCAVIASAIVEEKTPEGGACAAYQTGFFNGPVSAWCALIGLDWRFVVEQAIRLCAFQCSATPVTYRGEGYGDATVFETGEGAAFAWRKPNGSVDFQEFDSMKACRAGLRASVARHAQQRAKRSIVAVAEGR